MYTKLGLFLTGLVVITGTLTAQTQQVKSIAKFDTQYTLTDANGLPMNRSVLGVGGFPYVFANFKMGSIHLKNGKVTNAIPLQLDLTNHQIHFVSANKEIGMMNGEFVHQIVLSDTTQQAAKDYIFRTGYPAIDKHTSNEFYEVLSEGNITLLKSLNKKLETNKNEFSGEVVKEFVLKEDFYIFMDGQIKRLKKDKEVILNLMKDKQIKIIEYINNNKGSFKNKDYLVELFKYYNKM